MTVKRRLASQPYARLASARGQTATEFLMIGGAVAAILVVVLVGFRGQVRSSFTTMGRCLSSAVGGSTAGCGAGGSATSASPGRPAGALPGVFGPTGALGGGTGSPAPRGPGAAPGGRALTGPAGTMGGPLVTLPPPGSVAVGPISPRSPYLELGGDAIDTGKIWIINGVEGILSGQIVLGGPETSLVAPQYGNWFGAGWWGGSTLENRVGVLPPTDWLDAVGQKHDMGYQIAEEMGAVYGDAEKYRLMALADEIAARDTARLPDDPSKWVPPPSDIEEARRNRDRLMEGFSQVHNRWSNLLSGLNNLSPFQGTGPMTEKGLEFEQNRRVEKWNEDFRARQADWLNK